jgi:hypothetical protein
MSYNDRNLTGTNNVSPVANILPAADNSIDLGNALQRFRNIYGVTINAGTLNAGPVSCRAITPTATASYDLGTSSVRWANIYSGSITTADLSLSGTFTPSSNIVPGTHNTYTLGVTGTRWSNIYSITVTITSALTCSGTATLVNITSTGTTALNTVNITGTTGTAAINAAGHVSPTSNSAFNLGTTSLRWGTVYAVSLDTSGNSGIGGILYPKTTLSYDLGTSSQLWRDLWINQVLIGSSAGWHLNEVGSTLYCTNTGGVGVSMASGATAWAAVSDKRVKRDIQYLPSTGTLAKLLTLKPCFFNYISDTSAIQARIGLIAQDVEGAFPDIINTEPDSVGIKSIRYTDLVPYLVKGLQELSAKVDALTAEVDALKKKAK